MKKLIIISLLFAACKKDALPIVQGGTYRVQPNVFSSGAWQPQDTLYAYSLYFNEADGLQYCECLGPGIGTPLMAKSAKIDSLDNTVIWLIPLNDLR